MKKILSRNNPLIKKVASLHQAKYRKLVGQFIAEGIRACATLVDADCQPITIFAVDTMLSHAKKLTTEENIVLVDEAIVKKISTATTPSGLLGLFSIPSAPKIDLLSSGIVLAQINNPGNMGTLIRSTTAMNKKSVVIIEGADPWSPKVVQASVGTIGLVNIFQLSWKELLNNKKQLQLCALVVLHGKKLHNIDWKNTLVVIGSEAKGIPKDWLNECDSSFTLSMPGKVESLNAAVAGSIALYLSTMQ